MGVTGGVAGASGVAGTSGLAGTAGGASTLDVDGGLTFDRFYAAEYRRVLVLAWTLSGDRGRAEEIAHDAFEAAYRRWDEVQGYEAAGAWVRRVVVNKSATGVRRLVAERRALGRWHGRTGADVATSGDERLPDEELWAAVRDLPERQRQTVALHYVEDRSVADIARVLDLAESTVKVHLHRGRQTLAERLADRDRRAIGASSAGVDPRRTDHRGAEGRGGET